MNNNRITESALNQGKHFKDFIPRYSDNTQVLRYVEEQEAQYVVSVIAHVTC